MATNKHIHHIIPKHAGGTDDKENLIELTIEEHAEAHRVLYQKYGRYQDKLAWKGLLGIMPKDEIIREILSMTHKGKVTSEETKRKQSLAKLGKLNPMYGTESPNRGKFGEDSPRWGSSHSEETKKKQSLKAKNRKRVSCEYCGKTDILPGHYGRYHKNGKCMSKENK